MRPPRTFARLPGEQFALLFPQIADYRASLTASPRRNKALLSFGADADDAEDASSSLPKTKFKSAHDALQDSRLSSRVIDDRGVSAQLPPELMGGGLAASAREDKGKKRAADEAPREEVRRARLRLSAHRSCRALELMSFACAFAEALARRAGRLAARRGAQAQRQGAQERSVRCSLTRALSADRADLTPEYLAASADARRLPSSKPSSRAATSARARPSPRPRSPSAAARRSCSWSAKSTARAARRRGVASGALATMTM